MNLREYVLTLPDPRQAKVRELAQETCSCERSVQRWVYGYAIPGKLKREAIARVTGLTESELWPELADGSGQVSSRRLLEYMQSIPTAMQQFRKEISEATGVSDMRVRLWMSGLSIPSKIIRKKLTDMTGLNELEIWPRLAERGKHAES